MVIPPFENTGQHRHRQLERGDSYCNIVNQYGSFKKGYGKVQQLQGSLSAGGRRQDTAGGRLPP